MSSSGQLEGGGGGSTTTFRELFASYLDRSNPSLLGKVDFRGIVADAGRATVAAFFVGVSSVWLAFFNGVELVIRTAERALGDVLLAVGLSPTALLRPAQAATTAALSELGLIGLPVATATQLLSFGAVAAVIVLAWGSG